MKPRATASPCTRKKAIELADGYIEVDFTVIGKDANDLYDKAYIKAVEFFGEAPYEMGIDAKPRVANGEGVVLYEADVRARVVKGRR